MFFAVGIFPVGNNCVGIFPVAQQEISRQPFFAVGIFPVGQFCRDISLWHNVGMFPIGCVGTSTFPPANNANLYNFRFHWGSQE
jgi:hypothetical protein